MRGNTINAVHVKCRVTAPPAPFWGLLSLIAPNNSCIQKELAPGRQASKILRKLDSGI